MKEALMKMIALSENENNAIAIYFKMAELAGATKAEAFEAFDEYYAD